MDAPRPAGLAASLQHLVAQGLALVQVRLELLAVEIEEERSRLARLLTASVFAFFLLGFGALSLAMLLTLIFWDTQRYLALAVLCAAFLGGGAVCLVICLRLVRQGSRLFGASIAELAQDRAALEPARRHEH